MIPSSPIPEGFVPPQRSKKAKAYLYPDEEAALMACRSIPLVARVAFGVLAREGMRISELLERAVAEKIRGVSGSCEDILAHQEALWTFVERDGVEPTNNHAERELRALVLWRRRSFGSQSVRGGRFAARMMSIAHTARKQGRVSTSSRPAAGGPRGRPPRRCSRRPEPTRPSGSSGCGGAARRCGRGPRGAGPSRAG